MTALPVGRIRMIMKSSPEVTSVSQDSLFLITKATELFVENIAKESYARRKVDGFVNYNDLAEAVAEEENFQFLEDVLPKKILARDFLKANSKAEKEEDS
ncbi:chromatin accessibility complex protein 1-like [Anneissia japonica]|uniref:chromatin accessibility complex protein 1-like n=1 Tax=Anneissia japonica TaxID=1529436 RepID=UPI0014254F58|nr:chromatin accessibility complex protein 1-like [Anneissia japonica]